MNPLRLEQADAKTLRLSGVPAGVAHCLFELPDILRRRDQPAAQQRLFPDPTVHDPDANAEWHRLMDSDLQHLFASAAETVARDLTQFDRDRGQLSFPAAHLSAWMSALNQARLILGAQFNVTEGDMDREAFDIREPKERALLQIHLLGWVLQLFIEHASG